MHQFAWLIPALPLLGFILIGILNKRLPVLISGGIASAMVFLSFVVSVAFFFEVKDPSFVPERIVLFDWITVGDLKIDFSFLIDRLSVIMLLVITGVGTLIHIYSIGYMHHEPDHSRFFSYLNLFVFFMLLLVLGSNYIVMFAGWEGVGLCSYLLIGFWFKNIDYSNAAKKAFIMNRIGDLGFLLGVFLIFTTFGSVSFKEVFEGAKGFGLNNPSITAICLLLFVGAIGKSAQIPLFTWLPDAMAGPTPVSALIHAATMVTAGIYMVVRSNVLFALSPYASQIVAIIGLATAFFAATIGLKQNDIKKVLAYSTVSQLGYMFVALGIGAYDTALFHVVTHAFFKALLFLGAGSVIHAMSGEQDIRRMGGLKGKLPVTHMTFLIGTLAIAGIPPFAGFFSKDEILAASFGYSMPMFMLLSLTSVLTAVYMFRLYWLVFYGDFRGTTHQKTHLHESPVSMTFPLIVLAILSAVGGFMGMPEIFHAPHLFSEFLAPVIWRDGTEHASHLFEYILIGVSVLLLIIIFIATRKVYVDRKTLPEEDNVLPAGIPKLLSNKYYIDEIYEAVITKPLDSISTFSYKFIEIGVISAIINGISKALTGFSSLLRFSQSGQIGGYILSMVVGIILLIVLTLIV
ncbi:MAG: NADH-quinone oxidoreductase subunit L [Bacteroidetes bacterium]|nr:NADH-quinone oxidoreductase subunit L [Bacteroidota bacterium]